MSRTSDRRQPPIVSNSHKTQVEKIASMRSRLRKGEIGEALFISKVLSLGMNILKPFGQNSRYDFMVEVMGKVSRVQVKSTWQAHKCYGPPARRPRTPFRKTFYYIHSAATKTRGPRVYSLDELDFLAVYLAPEDQWFIIPISRFANKLTLVLPGRYERYREAWDQLCPRGTYVGDIKACAETVVRRQSSPVRKGFGPRVA